MKRLLTISLILVGTLAFSQNKNAIATVDVDGVCMMCKSRIEKACYSTKGVKSASWDVNTHELKLFFDERKTSLDTIKSNIAKAGHDTKDIKATDQAYASIHACCKYRDTDVVNDHKDTKEQENKQ